MNDDGSTHMTALETEVKRVANSCDLGGFNKTYFLTSGFVGDIAVLIQQKESAAFARGVKHGRATTPKTAADVLSHSTPTDARHQ